MRYQLSSALSALSTTEVGLLLRSCGVNSTLGTHLPGDLNYAYLLLSVGCCLRCLPRGYQWLGWSGLSGSLQLPAHQTSTSALPLAAAVACRVRSQLRLRRRVVVPLAATRRPNQLQQPSQRQVPWRAAAAESAAEEEGMRALLVVDRRRLLPLLRGSGLGSIAPCQE